MNDNLPIEIDFRSRVPIYIQIMNQVKHLIAAGVLNPGDQLPTVRQLATDLRINFNTVARSYKLLDEEGVISTQHGRGTYILEAGAEANGEKLRFEELLRLTERYLNDVQRLGYGPEQVRDVVERKLALWLQTGEPPPVEDPTETP